MMICRNLLLFIFTATLIVLGFSGQALARVLIKPDAYLIQMSNSNFTVAGSSDAEHSPLILWPTRPTATWGFDTTGNGYYVISSNESVLDGGNGQTGSPITLKRYSKDWAKQLWKVVKVGRYYKFINMKTGQAMMLSKGKRNPGSTIENAPVADTMDQLFCIQRLESQGYCGEGGPNEDYSDDSLPAAKERKAPKGQKDAKERKAPEELENSFKNR